MGCFYKSTLDIYWWVICGMGMPNLFIVWSLVKSVCWMSIVKLL